MLRWLLAVVVAVVAVVFLVIGAGRPDGSYGASVWANLGTTLLLALPLILLEKLFARRVKSLDERIDQVQTSVDTVNDRLAAVDRSTAEAIDEVQRARVKEATEPGIQIVDKPSFTSVYEAIAHARQSGAIGRELYIRLEEHQLTLGFKVDTGGAERVCMVDVIPDDPDTATVRRAWVDREDVEEFFVNLYQDLADKSAGPAPKLTPDPVLRRLADTIIFAERRRLDAGAPAPVIEIPTPHWFITANGLEHIDGRASPYSEVEIRRAPVPPQSAIGVTDEEELRRAWLAAHMRLVGAR